MSTKKDQNDYRKLKKILDLPYIPNNLEKTLLDNLELQITKDKIVVRRNRFLFTTSIAASVLIGFFGLYFVMSKIHKTPSVALVYEHVQEEKHITGQPDGGYAQWMLDKGIVQPVDTGIITLSKNCLIGNIKAKHLRFKLDSEPSHMSGINMFFHASEDKLINQSDTFGEINGQKWLLLKPANNIKILVLYEKNAHKRQVENIIETMFPKQTNRTI